MFMEKLQPKTNTFAALLAGGSGTRMGNPDKPKQFLLLGDTPILVHALEKFCVSGCFDAVFVLVPELWLHQTQDILHKYCPEFLSMVRVVAGGNTRTETIECALAAVEEAFDVNDETIIVTHDSVRPFVSHRIIEENVTSAREWGACDTVIPATDTIVESMDGSLISAIPDRRNLYQGQTPQSFNLRKLGALLSSLTPDEREILTDACKIFLLRGERVALVRGDAANIKITYPEDLRIAAAFLEDPRA